MRYGIAGGSELENVQPIVARAHIGVIAVAHNLQIVNASRLQRTLEEEGGIFHGTGDSGIALHLIQGAKRTLLEKLKKACLKLEGTFSFGQLKRTDPPALPVREKSFRLRLLLKRVDKQLVTEIQQGSNRDGLAV